MSDTKPCAFTDVFVRGFKNNTGKRVEIRDTVVVGLILRISATGTKSFSLQARGSDDQKMRIKIGNYPVLSIKNARAMAKIHLAAISRGEDPRETARLAKAATQIASMTLADLLDEAEGVFAPTRSIWRRNSRFGRKKAEARAAIENVFGPLLTRPLTKLSTDDCAKAVKNYKSKKSRCGKTTANGAAARALAYLKPVFDWAAGRGTFVKKGAGREPKLDMPDLVSIQDPSLDDPTLEFQRERVLSQAELLAAMPLMVYPAPEGLRQQLDPRQDYGPIAFRFLLLTLSRIEEVEAAQCGDFDLNARTWTKSVKTRRKRGARGPLARRVVTMPISDDAITLLLSLPSFTNGKPGDLVFPSSQGGRLCNWERTQTAINNASGTCGWHRHDLRRTAATILRQLGVAPSIVDKLLSHVNPLCGENVSGAAPNYMIDTKILLDAVDHERLAVNFLAKALAGMCSQGPVSEAVIAKDIDQANTSKKNMSSPWALPVEEQTWS